MTFIEVTSTGKNFRHPDMRDREYYGFKNDELREFFADGGNSFPRFVLKDFTRTDWELVESEEVIEVGDWGYAGGGSLEEVEVKYVDPKGFAFVHVDNPNHSHFAHEPTYCIHTNRLKLIRKGPKVEVFEGVTIDGMGLPFTKSGKGTAHRTLGAFSRDYKTYMLTLIEEPNEIPNP